MHTRFTMIVAVHLIVLKNDEVLLLRRHGTGFLDGHHALIAGCVDGNETVTQAVIREAREEANIILQPEWLCMASVMHAKVPGGMTGESTDFFFITKQWDNTIANNEPHKHDDLRFFPLNNLPETLLPISRAGLYNALNGISFAQHGW